MSMWLEKVSGKYASCTLGSMDTTRGLRVIIAGRLSRKVADRDQSGFDSQEREAVAWAQREGHEVVAIVADYAKGPSDLDERKHLAPWVTQPSLLARYDAVVALKVDRLTRADKQGTNRLEKWAHDNRKKIMIAHAGVHFPAEGNNGVAWDVYLRQAHQEWLDIGERYRRMQTTRKAAGSLIGRPAFGYMIVRDGPIKVLRPDPMLAPVVAEMVSRYIGGASYRDVAIWLSESGIPVPNHRPGGWDLGTVGRLLRNEMLIGRRMNASGKVELTTEPLISQTTWTELQAELGRRARLKGIKRETVAMLTNIIFCECGAAMYRHVSKMTRKKSGTSYMREYYRCSADNAQKSKCRNMIGQDTADTWTNGFFVLPNSAFSDIDMYTVEYPEPDDHADRIAAVEQRLRDVDWKSPDAMATAAELHAELQRLSEAPVTRAEPVRTPTGQKVGEYWAALDDGGRRAFLLRANQKIIRARGDQPYWQSDPREMARALADAG
jgi:DNA invertase Pin-like site-specific DNA recombinase